MCQSATLKTDKSDGWWGQFEGELFEKRRLRVRSLQSAAVIFNGAKRHILGGHDGRRRHQQAGARHEESARQITVIDAFLAEWVKKRL